MKRIALNFPSTPTPVQVTPKRHTVVCNCHVGRRYRMVRR